VIKVGDPNNANQYIKADKDKGCLGPWEEDQVEQRFDVSLSDKSLTKDSHV